MAKCAIYTRVSSSRQVEGKSLEVQERQGIEFCKNSNLDYEVFAEQGCSAYTDDPNKRPQMKRVLSLIKKGQLQWLFATDYDRLARNKSAINIIYKVVEQHHVVLQIGSSKIEMWEGNDEFQADIFSIFAYHENKKRARKSVDSKRLMAEQGFFPGSRPMFGYKVVGDRSKRKLELHPDHKKTVRMMADWVLEGYTVTEIVDKLFDLNIEPPTLKFIKVKKKIWSNEHIIYILKSSTITGRYRLNGKHIKNIVVPCPAIISEEEQQEIIKRLRKNMHIVERKRRSKHCFEDGKAKCVQCGRKIYAARTKFETREGTKYTFRLWCSGRNRKVSRLTELCTMPTMDGQDLQRVIWCETAALIQSPNSLVDEYKKQSVTEDAQIINLMSTDHDYTAKISEKKEEISKLMDLYTGSQISKERLEEKVNELDDKVKALENEGERIRQQLEEVRNLRVSTEKIAKFIENLDCIHRLNDDIKIDLLELLIKEILIDYDDLTQTHKVNIVYQFPLKFEDEDFLRHGESLDFCYQKH